LAPFVSGRHCWTGWILFTIRKSSDHHKRLLSMTSSIPTESITIDVDGQPIEAERGLSVVAALMRVGIRKLRESPTGAPRGAFCMMGVCQECLVEIDGRRRQACLVVVESGMRIVTGMKA
jgi:predicted molibdopterin-dependent oxidoreductase YjgC